MMMKTTTSRSSATQSQIWLTVLICGLGYFVDIYDLILFSIVRETSLREIGVAAASMDQASSLILTSQMIGMLIGGVLFGILADKRGRLSVMLGAILLYSVMNIANAFVSSVEMYAVFRFLSGIGLAGELGVAVTLVSEIMPKNTRGFGTTIVASLGILGAVGAYLVHEAMAWKAAFIVGGVMGLLLLLMRIGIGESVMFATAKASNIARGNFMMLFRKGRIGRYLSSIAIGLPVWYVVGILVTFAPGFSVEMGSTEPVNGGACVMWAYVGLAAGDLASGVLSQLFSSRRKAILLFLALACACIFWYLFTSDDTASDTYLQCGVLGFTVGYWAVFVTTAAEQFGTNLRATVATTVPNFVRGALALMLMLYGWLRGTFSGSSTPRIDAALVVGGITMLLAFSGWLFLRETYGRELDYAEVD